MGVAKKHVPLEREEGESANDYLARCQAEREWDRSWDRIARYIPIPAVTWIYKNTKKSRGHKRKRNE